MPSTPETKIDADGDVVVQNVSQPVFEFVTAPLLDRWSRQSLVQWKQVYDRYWSACSSAVLRAVSNSRRL
jgi:hypothetical protein